MLRADGRCPLDRPYQRSISGGAVVIVFRSDLTGTYGVAVRAVVADLSTEAGVAEVGDILKADASVEILVNNAGVSPLGSPTDLPR